jgi:DHA2 family multidrug resistance protein
LAVAKSAPEWLSVIGFTLASALCGAATSLGELVLFRALQGVAGAGLIPLSQATLLQINPLLAVWAPFRFS